MTHHEGVKMEGKKEGRSPEESSEMVQRQRSMEEVRGHDISKSTMTTEIGGPEAGESNKEPGIGPHTMQTGSPSRSSESKEGFGMAGSQGTPGTVRGSHKGQSRNK